MTKRIFIVLALSLAFCMIVSGVAEADDPKNANELYEAGDFAAAMELFKSEAEDGSGEAMDRLGRMYLFGQGVEQSYELAFDWIQKSAQLGNALAFNNLGDFYENGFYVEQDFAKARECYEKAVELGEPFGYVSLGGMYEKGHGVEKDLEKAAEYYRSAIELGRLDAQPFLDAIEKADIDITAGSPWLASTVQGAVKEDTSTSLKDDYYLYVNKDSLLSYEFEPGYSSVGVIPQRDIDNDRDILALFTDFEPESRDAKLAKDMYDLFLDWDSRNALGVQPLKEITDAVEGLSSIDEMNEYYATVPYELQAVLPFGFAPMVDYNDSSTYIMSVGSGELLLDDSAEYGELSEFGAIMKDVWSEFTLYILGRLGYSEEEAARKLSNCFELESALAPYILTSDEYNEPDILDKINNVVSLAEFETMQGNVPILQVMDLCGYERKENLILLEPAWLDAFKGIYDDEHLELLKDYMIVHSALGFGEALDKECFVKYMESANILSGAEGLLEDEQYAAQYAMNTMYWQVSKLYCEKYFTPQDKQNVSDIIHKVLNAYAEMLAGEDFIGEQTKRKAIEKLDNMVINVLYPDDWTKYLSDDLDFASASEGGTLYKALLALARSETIKSAEEFSEPVDRYKWSGLLPTTVNAFYDPTANSVNMLAAFCRGEIYSADMPLEEQYAKVGTIIAHEISHSFDGLGSQFDKDGNYSEWWTEEDRAAFDAKLRKIADYADTICCWDGTHINGSIITGEACADMGAMACMLRIAKSVEGFDYGLFFRSFAELWSYLRSYNSFLSQLKNEHPPEFYRVNATVQQFEEFYDCYGVEEDDGMYLAPEKRIAIW